MLEVWTKFISAVMLSLYGFYAIKKNGLVFFKFVDEIG